jgi:hypothetical protein
MNHVNETSWFAAGLRFECVGCGACCGGEEGNVWVTDADIERMAPATGMPAEEFRREYVKDVGTRKSLRERPNGECVMYENGCRVYEARPEQCASWPFWLGNLESEEKWRAIAARCPGMGRGRLYSREEIAQLTTDHGHARAL